MADPLDTDPPRLAEQDGETAELLRSADAEFRKKLDESGAFRSVERTRLTRSAVAWGLGCAAVALVLVGITQGAGPLGSRTAAITVTAEPLPPPVSVEPTVPKPTDEVPAARVDPPPPAHALPARVAESDPPSEARCRKLKDAGDAERAVECFRALGRGAGVEAEVGLYEAARLAAESLRDVPRALRLLDEHMARFPAGAMRGEVRWLRVQSLERTGRFDDALSDSEALLAAPEGRSLSSELHWLRAGIYETRNDCQRALSELVSLVGEKGARGDAAEMRRAACLERLGRKRDALAAYEKYLERAEPERGGEARARVEALRP